MRICVRSVIHKGYHDLNLAQVSAMFIKYYLDKKGNRVYTFQDQGPEGEVVFTGHPAKFSPDDKYSGQRVQVKKRFNILPTQQPLPEM